MTKPQSFGGVEGVRATAGHKAVCTAAGKYGERVTISTWAMTRRIFLMP